MIVTGRLKLIHVRSYMISGSRVHIPDWILSWWLFWTSVVSCKQSLWSGTSSWIMLRRRLGIYSFLRELWWSLMVIWKIARYAGRLRISRESMRVSWKRTRRISRKTWTLRVEPLRGKVCWKAWSSSLWIEGNFVMVQRPEGWLGKSFERWLMGWELSAYRKKSVYLRDAFDRGYLEWPKCASRLTSFRWL